MYMFDFRILAYEFDVKFSSDFLENHPVFCPDECNMLIDIVFK